MKKTQEEIERENEQLKLTLEFKEIARIEGEKGRDQAIKFLAVFSLLLTSISFFGAYEWISYAAKKAAEEQIGAEFLIKSEANSITIDSIKDVAISSLNNVIRIQKQINEDPWDLIDLQNDWTNWTGNEANPASYIKDELGRVYLRGLIQSGIIGKPIFKLPKDYSPKHKEIFIVKTNKGQTRLDVEKKWGCVNS